MTRVACRRLAAVLSVLALAVGAGARAQGPASLEGFEITQWIAAGRYAPEFSIGLDNNGEILMACRSGAMPATLVESGIKFVDSQIEFLIAMGLLVRDANGLLITTFPILEEEAAARLRRDTAAIAAELVGVVEDQVAELQKRLATAGLEDYGYPILFSYVLDGMVWGFFEEYRKVDRRALSARRPFWAGQVWAMQSRRPFVAGTLSIADRGLSLRIVGSRGDSEWNRRLAPKRGLLKLALSQFVDSGKVEDDTLREELGRLGLVDADGLWSVPVIDELEKGPVFRAAETVTETLVDAILDAKRVDLEDLERRHGLRGAEQTLVIVYHELMWDLMNEFESAGLVQRPKILEEPDVWAPELVGAVSFLVDRRPPKSDRQDQVAPEDGEPEPSPMPDSENVDGAAPRGAIDR